MRAELLSKACAGDSDAFSALTQPHQRELRVHCYRLLGSLEDAEDALQETLLAAWQNLAAFEGRSSLRTWLYRIATNRCLNALRTAKRRPAKAWDVPGVEPPEPTRLGEVAWLEPFPDALLEGALDAPLGPDARYERSEAISLAFVSALQRLPPRQLAVLVLRDVLGFPANEVAAMLESTLDSVNSVLKRARESMQQLSLAERVAPPAPRSAAETAIAERFASAYESGNITALTALLTDDVFASMPPLPHEYQGRDVVVRLLDAVYRAGRRFELVATRANGQPAFGAYLRGAGDVRPAVSLIVLGLTHEGIHAITRFDARVLPWFNLRRSTTDR